MSTVVPVIPFVPFNSNIEAKSSLEERIHHKIYQLNPHRQQSNYKSYEAAMKPHCNCNPQSPRCWCFETIMPYHEWLYWTQSQIIIRPSLQKDCPQCSDSLFVYCYSKRNDFNDREYSLIPTGRYYTLLSNGKWCSGGPKWFHKNVCNGGLHNLNLVDLSSLSTHGEKLSQYLRTLCEEYTKVEAIDRAEIISKTMCLRDQLTIDVAKVICGMLYYL